MSEQTTVDASGPGGAGPGSGAYLVLRIGDESQVVDLHDGDEVVLGRGGEAQIRVDDPKASRAHARVHYAAGALTLTDLGSRNGTLVNGELLRGEARLLSSGDVFWIGEAEVAVAERAVVARAPSVDVDVDGLVVADASMVEVFRLVDRVAPLTTSVLLLGETGVGKEVVAAQIHARSARAARPFVRLNCGALPEALLESELFGHERGAFTGAERRKPGLFEAASGGTLFLDEVGELKPELQAKLLRAIEGRRIMRVGGREEIDVDVRIISATHRDLEAQPGRGDFRDDLYFRLATFVIRIPPLRDRPNEVALLAELFVRQLSVNMRRRPPTLHPAARARLERHAWPGNVRELRNVIERALVVADGERILPTHLPDHLAAAPAGPGGPSAIRARVETAEQRAVEEALAAEGGNQTRAARRLGISRRTLIYKLEKYQLRPRDRAR